jgi:hypothetical protein
MSQASDLATVVSNIESLRDSKPFPYLPTNWNSIQDLVGMTASVQFAVWKKVCADFRNFAPGRSEIRSTAIAMGGLGVIWPVPP